jgi:hypothetical protein
MYLENYDYDLENYRASLRPEDSLNYVYESDRLPERPEVSFYSTNSPRGVRFGPQERS